MIIKFFIGLIAVLLSPLFLIAFAIGLPFVICYQLGSEILDPSDYMPK